MSNPTLNSDPIALTVSQRDDTLNPRQLRANDLIPATVYGKDFGPVSIQVPGKEFFTHYKHGLKNYKLAGVKGQEVTVTAHQVQLNPITDAILSIEFLRQAS